MKRSRLAVALLGLGMVATQAQTDYFIPDVTTGPYLRASIGPSFFEEGRLTEFGAPANSRVRYDTGVAANMALGYSFDRYVALDFQTGFIGARIDAVDGYDSHRSSIMNVPLLGNIMLSVPIPRSIVVPYIGAGAGGAVTTFDTHYFSDGVDSVSGHESDTVFAWQAFAGLKFMLNPQMTLGLGYQYFATANPAFSYPPSPEFDVDFRGVRTHSVLFTFEWKFW